MNIICSHSPHKNCSKRCMHSLVHNEYHLDCDKKKFCENVMSETECVEYGAKWTDNEIDVLFDLSKITIYDKSADIINLLTWKEIAQILTNKFKKFRTANACSKRYCK